MKQSINIINALIYICLWRVTSLPPLVRVVSTVYHLSLPHFANKPVLVYIWITILDIGHFKYLNIQLITLSILIQHDGLATRQQLMVLDSCAYRSPRLEFIAVIIMRVKPAVHYKMHDPPASHSTPQYRLLAETLYNTYI